jgi:hypothetical protein
MLTGVALLAESPAGGWPARRGAAGLMVLGIGIAASNVSRRSSPPAFLAVNAAQVLGIVVCLAALALGGWRVGAGIDRSLPAGGSLLTAMEVARPLLQAGVWRA